MLTFQQMSTVAEIESAISQLPPEDFRQLHEWMSKRATGEKGRRWTPEELTEGARQMVAEPDPDKAKVLKEKLMRGFYGLADA